MERHSALLTYNGSELTTQPGYFPISIYIYILQMTIGVCALPFNLPLAPLECWGCSPFEPFLLGRRHLELLRRWCLTWTSKTRQEKLCQPVLTKLLKTLNTSQYWSRNLGPRDNMFLVMQSTLYSPLSEIEETKKAQGQRKQAEVLEDIGTHGMKIVWSRSKPFKDIDLL